MANLKISQLPAASIPLTGSEIVPIIQGGQNNICTAQNIANLASSGGTPGGQNRQVQFNNSGVFAGASGLIIGTNGQVYIQSQTTTACPLNIATGTASTIPHISLTDYTGQGYTIGLSGSGSTQELVINANFSGSSGQSIRLKFDGTTNFIFDQFSGLIFSGGQADISTQGNSHMPITIQPEGDQASTGGHLYLLGAEGWGYGTGNPNNVYIRGGTTATNGTVTSIVSLGYDGTTKAGNVSLFGSGSFQGGVNVLNIEPATTNPTAAPASGVNIYVDGTSGYLMGQAASGSLTTIVPSSSSGFTPIGAQGHVSSQSIATGSTTNISLVSVVYDTASFFNLSSSPTTINIPVTGYYLTIIECQWSANCESILTMPNGYGTEELTACEFISHSSIDYYTSGTINIGTLEHFYGSSIFCATRVSIQRVM